MLDIPPQTTAIKRRVIFGAAWSLFGSSGQQLIAFLVFLYLARALSPTDVGLVSLGVILIDIVTSVSRFGLVEALQRDKPSAETQNAIGLFLLLSGFGGAMLIVIFAVVVRVLNPQISNVLLLLSPVALLQALSTLPEATLRREFKYRRLSVQLWTATVISSATAVIMVQVGYGLYSLIGQRLAASLIMFILLWRGMAIALPRLTKIGAARPLLKTGGQVLIANLSGILNGRLADATTGLFLSAASLGFLRLGWRCMDALVQITVTPISSVALASLSQLREHPEALGRAYIRLTQFVSIASIPVFFGIGAISPLIIPELLGQKWVGAVIVFELLGFLMIAGSVNYFFPPLMVAVGRSDVVVRQSIAQLIVSVPLLFIGSFYGLAGILLAHITRACLFACVNIIATSRLVKISAMSVVMAILPAALCSLVMAYSAREVLRLTASSSNVINIGASCMAGLVTYISLLFIGDVVGAWPNYVRGSLSSLVSGIRSKVE